MHYGFLDIDNIGHVLIPKNASTFLLSKEHTVIDLNYFLSMKKRCAYLRNPIERLFSAYQFFNDLLNRSVLYDGFSLDVAESYEGFVDFALENIDAHWRPQTEFLYHKGELIVNEVELLTPKNNAINASKKLEFNKEYRIKEVRNYYTNDFRLLEKAKWL